MSEPIKSMPPTEQYKQQWERIFGRSYFKAPEPQPTYRNGCPVIETVSTGPGPQKDDL